MIVVYDKNYTYMIVVTVLFSSTGESLCSDFGGDSSVCTWVALYLDRKCLISVRKAIIVAQSERCGFIKDKKSTFKKSLLYLWKYKNEYQCTESDY